MSEAGVKFVYRLPKKRVLDILQEFHVVSSGVNKTLAKVIVNAGMSVFPVKALATEKKAEYNITILDFPLK